MAPATPPPKIKSLFAALTMASVSISVRSPCSMTTFSERDFIKDTSLAKSRASSLQELLVCFLVETQNHLRTPNHNRPANQIRLICHQLNSFRSRRRIFFHVSRPVELIARIQELFIVPLPNQPFQLSLG